MSKKVKSTSDSLKNPYADGAIVNLGKTRRTPVKVLTGRPSIDYVTDGGIPIGRQIIIAGEPSAGKSTLAIQVTQAILDKLDKEDAKVLYCDNEYTLTTDYIEDLGGNPFMFDHYFPQSTEKMFTKLRQVIPDYDVIIIDSINNSASEEQHSKDAEGRTMANRAITMSSQLPICVGMCNQHNTTLIILSQVRDNMNATGPYSPKTVIPGGRSFHHNSSMTLELKKSTKKKEGKKNEMELYDTIGGHMVTVKCSKNKVGTPDRTVKIEFTHGRGYTLAADVAGAAVAYGLVEKAGSWLKYNGETICQGQDKLKPMLEDNPQFMAEIQAKLRVIEKEN